MRISTRVDTTGAVTLAVCGTLNAAHVADFDRALGQVRALERPVVLDLSDVRLIDRPALKYLIDLMQHDVRLVICPDYVRHWIDREASRESIE